MNEDTIFALSSGRVPAAIAVVRISGPKARVGLETFGVKLPEPRRAARAQLIDPDSRETIDDALALWFSGPRSETGEDTVELHLHGGRAVLARVFAVLGALPGFRPAGAGEFTKRAVLNESSIFPMPRASAISLPPRRRHSAARPCTSIRGRCRSRWRPGARS